MDDLIMPNEALAGHVDRAVAKQAAMSDSQKQRNASSVIRAHNVVQHAIADTRVRLAQAAADHDNTTHSTVASMAVFGKVDPALHAMAVKTAASAEARLQAPEAQPAEKPKPRPPVNPAHLAALVAATGYGKPPENAQ